MDGEFSPVRPDGASGRARRQYQRIQARRVFFSGKTKWAAFYKTRPVFCPTGQLKNSCSILLPAKLVWLLFVAVD